MNVGEILQEIAAKARKDEKLKEAFKLSRNSENPYSEFCKIARGMGYELYPMDIIEAGDRFLGLLEKGVNGGGATHTVIYGSDDFYEQFFKEIGL